MNVLWIVGGVNFFPEAVALLSGKEMTVKSTGGWLSAFAERLSADQDINLAVATVSAQVKELTILQGNSILYFVLPLKSPKNTWKRVQKEFKPKVIHIHGTENYKNILTFLEANENDNVVVSIQGVIPAIKRYTHAGLSLLCKLLNVTIADIYLGNSLLTTHYINKLSDGTNSILLQIKHVIGRTICDRAYVWSINPEIYYHFNNEILRDTFYTGRWEYAKCNRHSIFLSQARTPLKGLHLLLKAMPLVLKVYPDTKIRIAGYNFTKDDSFHDKIRLTGYGKLINKMIKRFKLSNIIQFLDPLDADEMKQEYLSANLFISPSTIENSPNSLCEAQILGVPCLASYVGGVPDMIPNSQCGEMYRFDEPEVLAYKICEMFDSSKSFDNTVMQTIARKRHDPHTNVNELKEIYNKIVNG